MNFRQYKKKFFHKTMKHGGWRKYKKAMKEAGDEAFVVGYVEAGEKGVTLC